MSTLKHGHARSGKKPASVEYQAWNQMWQRCNNPKCASYSYYGGKGVSVCARWGSFLNFLADVGTRPSSKHSLDRYPNPNGNYEPDNVRWATWGQQNTNRGTYNHWITFKGETRSLSEWAKRAKIPVSTLQRRLKTWPIEEALTLELSNWSRAYRGKSVSERTLRRRRQKAVSRM